MNFANSERKYRFLFGGVMFGGNNSLFQSLKEKISTNARIDSSWILLEWDPAEFFARIPPVATNWTLKAGLVMRSRIRRLEKTGNRFDATFFNSYLPASFYGGIRKRSPHVISFDATPILMNRYAEWFNNPPSSDSFLEKFKFRFTRRVFDNATFLLPHSAWVRDSLVRDYGISEHKIVVVPPGIDVAMWIPPAREETTGAGPEKLRILFVGSDLKRKGADLLLNIAGKEEFHNHEFHFLSYDKVQKQSDNVFIHSNIAPNSEALRKLYSDADIFVLPSRGDIQPVAILEAMSMGLPVISTRVGAIDQAVEDGQTGFLVPPGNEGAVVEKLRLLINNRELRLRFGQNARRVIETRHNLERNVAIIVELMVKAADMVQRPPA